MRILFFLLFSLFTFSQQTKSVDFLKCDANVMPHFNSNSINGIVSYEFKVNSVIDTIRIDAKNIYFNEVQINGKKVEYKNNDKELLLFEGFKIGKNKLSIVYNCMPKQTMYFVGTQSDFQIWTQGQGRYTSHWLPSFDDVNEKVIFKLSVYFDNKFHVLSNGNLTKKVASVKLGEMKTLW